ncbi:MAG: hypothetical protein M9900_06455 [Flavobacteriales bacterium]|nr:hypothetical protein [Flavobacteriales bacterium]
MSLRELLSGARLYRLLLLLNGLATLAVCWGFRHHLGNDAWSYTTLADGILHGKYSLWWRLPVSIPDTFRNPGYPLFVAAFRWFTESPVPLQCAQLLMYFASVILMLRTIGLLGGGTMAKNVFLLILLPSIDLPYYIPTIFPEVVTMFLICAFVYTEVSGPRTWRRIAMLALLSGMAFQMRSSLLLFPVFWIVARWLLERKAFPWSHATTMLGVFGTTLFPYAMWNKSHHGVFRPTPLEGGAGAMHIGWWIGKIPGHTEHWYWGNVANHELIPLTGNADIPANIEVFDAEWSAIDSGLAPLLTRTDSIMLDSFAMNPRNFRTFNTRYTLAREEALKKAVYRHVLEEPGYTIALKAYTAIRLWVTGINVEQFNNSTLKGKLLQLYPLLLTLGIFLLAVCCIPIALLRHRPMLYTLLPLLIPVVYLGLVHIPFTIQARYTIPVRILLFAAMALSIEKMAGPGPRVTEISGKPD